MIAAQLRLRSSQAVECDGLWRRVCDIEYPNFDLSAGFGLTQLEAKRRSGMPFEDEVEFRFVRPRQTGKDHKGTNFLVIFALHLFGALYRE